MSLHLLGQTPTIEWQRCYGGSNADLFNSINILQNGDLIVGGGTLSNDGDITFNHGNTDLWIIRTDSMGSPIWQKCIGGSGVESGRTISILSNGNLLFTGSTTSDNGDVSGNHQVGMYDGWLVELNSFGTFVSHKCYGGSNNDALEKTISTINEGLLIVGNTSSIDGDVTGGGQHGNSDGWVVKVDSLRNIQWQKCFGGSFEDGFIDVFLTRDSGFVIGGLSNSNDGDISNHYGAWDFWLVKIDSSGNKLWDHSYGGSQDDILVSMKECADGGFILLGSTTSHDGMVSGIHDTIFGLADFWMIKVDSGGNLQWEKSYGGIGDDLPYHLILDYDGGYLLSGMTRSNDGDVDGNHGLSCLPYYCPDMWLVKTDSLGILIWQKCIGGSDGDNAENCILTSDSGYLVAGMTHSGDGDVFGSFNHGNGDSWLVKLTTENSGIPSSTQGILNFNVYLDADRNVRLSLYSEKNNNVSLEIIDMTGRVLLKEQIMLKQGLNMRTIYSSLLSLGVYMIRIGYNDIKCVKKIILY